MLCSATVSLSHQPSRQFSVGIKWQNRYSATISVSQWLRWWIIGSNSRQRRTKQKHHLRAGGVGECLDLLRSSGEYLRRCLSGLRDALLQAGPALVKH